MTSRNPDALIACVREGVGPAELRADAARRLLEEGFLVPSSTPSPSSMLAVGTPIDPRQPYDSIAGRDGHGMARETLTPTEFRPTQSQLLSVFWARYSPWFIGAGIGLAVVLFTREPGASDPSLAFSDQMSNQALSSQGLSNQAVSGRSQAPGSRVSTGNPEVMDLDLIKGPDWSNKSEGPNSERSDRSGRTSDSNIEGMAGIDLSAPCGQRLEGSVTAEEAEQLVDSFQTIEFTVARTKDTGKVSFLNSQDPYQGRFYVAIFPDDYAAFPEPPSIYFKNRCVAVRGSIELYRGTPQVVLRDATDLQLVEAESTTPNH